jgi:hypothetical protein
MGRPINKKYIGNPTNNGNQITLSYVWLEDSTQPETGFYIVKQKGTGKYLVSNGSRSGVVELVSTVPSSAGQGAIIVVPYNTIVNEFVKKINNRSVVTFSGLTYYWSEDSANSSNEVDFTFDTWNDPLGVGEEDYTVILIPGSFGEGGVGFLNENNGNIGTMANRLIGGLEIAGLYSINGGTYLLIQGDNSSLNTITISITEFAELTFHYVTVDDGVTLYYSSTVPGFTAGTHYEIESLVPDVTTPYLTLIAGGINESTFGYLPVSGAGSISNQINGYELVGWYEDTTSKIYINGDHPEITNIKVTIGMKTLNYNYTGSEGVSEFASDNIFGFQAGQTYKVWEFVISE